jgi:hypothetical protein
MMEAGTAGDGGIAHGALLIRFATAVLGRDSGELTAARTAVVEAMGGAALTDTAAVAALFNAIDRVADSTGIPLEEKKAEATADFRAAIGIDAFAAAAEKGSGN